MFWELEIVKTTRKGLWGRLLDIVFPIQPVVQPRTAFGSTYRHMAVRQLAGGKINWEAVADITGNGAVVLLPQGVELPEEIPLKEVNTKEFELQLLENTALAVLKSNQIAPAKKIVGIIDPNGENLNFAHAVVKNAAMLKVLTTSADKYERLADQMMESYGTPILLVEDEKGFEGCAFVISAENGVPDYFMLKTLSCPVLAVREQNFSPKTKVIEKFFIENMHDPNLQLPTQAEQTKFYAALYTHNKVRELGSLLPTGAYCKKNKLLLADILTYFVNQA